MGMTRIAALTAALCLTACAVGPDFEKPAPPAATNYGSAPISGETAKTADPAGGAQRFVAGMDIPADWWTLFHSPKLSKLVDDAIKNNPDVAAAQAALRQSHELYSAQWASFFPTVQGNFSATRAKNAQNTIAPLTTAINPLYNLYTAQLSLSYAPDIFGANIRATESAKAQEESSRFQLEATYLTLASNVVVTAIQEASLRGQVAATERLLALQHQLTEIVRRQHAIGTASSLDLLAQESAEAQTAQLLPQLQKQLGQARDALTALLGRLPSEEPAETFTLDDLALPTDLPVSLPSKLVEKRPDVREAEENFHAATAQVGVAVSAMLPQFDIAAGNGSSAFQAGQLFAPGNGFWSVGGSITQTLFDAGALLHKRRAADAAMGQAAAQYKAAVILACQNVADTLRALKADADALRAAATAEDAAHATFITAQRQLKFGTISEAALMNAEQTYQQAEIALVQARANRYSDTAALYQALGGGWWNRKDEGERDGQSGLAGE
jgi:NodT family efflux transporter outer membrane factor (OMF) lipoprotein